MPKIYDNIENQLSNGLADTLKVSKRSDFCVGYFNLRGWHEVADSIDSLVGMPVTEKVDFNIRAGNTLVGYATKKQIDTIAGLFVTEAHKKKILEQCDIVARAFARYKEIQLSGGDDYDGFKKAKDDLNERLKKLTNDLDGILYIEQYKGFNLEEKEYRTWLATHQPFHWFAEFYEIIAGKGGFDVVIGNQPYVELKKLNYKLLQYKTFECGNLYAPVIERYLSFLKNSSKSGMIIPHSSICTDRMSNLIAILKKQGLWLSSYDIRPSKLFDGVDQRLLIYISTVRLGFCMLYGIKKL
jgi:hypothetical protein